MEKVNLNKRVYSKIQYEKVIDTKFSQLGNTITPTPSTLAQTANAIDPTVEIDKFFQDYNRLFYLIPKTGEINSHEYLIKTSTNYVGSAFINDEIQALIDEINLLQLQNLELNQQIISLNISGSQQI